MEAKKRWEQCAEETMTRIRNASNTHNASISDSMTTLLQTYRSGFIAGQEYMESIQPNINKFIKYTEDVQSLKKRSESTRGMDSPPTERDSKLSSEHTKQPQKKSGIGRLIRKKSNLSNTNSKKEFDEFDELEESEKDSVELLEDTDSITFEFDPKTNEQIVRSADVPHLIAHMTHPSHIDISFRDAFFLLYRSFTTPLMVCSLIEENYYSTKDKDKKFRALAAFKFWLENYPADFIGNPELCEQFRKFLESSLARDNPSAENQLSASLNKIIEQNQTSSRRRHRIESQLHIEISLEHEQQARNILFEDLDPVVVAQQLTVLENRLFCAIKPMELLNKNWSGAEKATTAPNIIALTEHFNQTSRWVVNEIISKYSFKVRVETLKKFIAILQHARSLNNFCGVMSILAGVNSSPVRRLKSTWKELSESELQVVKDIERLMNHKGSYRCYRATLHSAKIPLVPFIGIYLKDLTFTEDGNPKYLDNLVNFSKCHKISTTVEEIIRYQVLYNIPPNPVLQCFLRNVEPIGEEEAYTLSTRIEPRDPSEAFENLLLEEDRLRKQVEELQLRVDDLKSMQNRQLTTVSILSDQVREQRKVIQQQSQQLASGKYDVELPVEEEKESRTDGPTRKITQVQLQDLFAQVAKLDVNENGRSSTDKWKSAASPQGSPRGARLKTKKKIIKKKVIGVGTGVALFDFTPENPDELSFKQNETITVLTTDESIGGEGWWIGLVDGKQGVFPKEYIIFTPHTKK